jgi:hypothetical protein
MVGVENKFHVIFLLLKYLFLNRLLDALYVTLSNKYFSLACMSKKRERLQMGSFH